MASFAKTQELMKQLSASQHVINDLVRENYELKSQLQEFVTRYENIGRNSTTSADGS